MSTSWGESETFLQDGIAGSTEPAAYEAAFDEVFLEMAAQGQSNFTASGDTGAYEAVSDLGTTNISQGLSGTSPYITAAGGTTLPGSQTRQTYGSCAPIRIGDLPVWTIRPDRNDGRWTRPQMSGRRAKTAPTIPYSAPQAPGIS